MKKIFVISLVVLALAMVGCTKKPSDTLGKLQSAAKSGNLEDAKKYYTKGTVKAMEELQKLFPVDPKKGDNKFAEGAKWTVVNEKIDGDKAEVKVKYTDHPDPKMKGAEITFNMKKEDGDWKLDLEKELNMALSMFKGMGGQMNNMLKGLKNLGK
ncbi:MAG: DUF4878 domain-containing protein [Spirochaetes bacterium]|nr:DUF4878 domain-containing protein [Spirochaetota bacterium]